MAKTSAGIGVGGLIAFALGLGASCSDITGSVAAPRAGEGRLHPAGSWTTARMKRMAQAPRIPSFLLGKRAGGRGAGVEESPTLHGSAWAPV